MRILARVVATLGLVALVTALLVWWTDRVDHSEGDAEVLATGLEVPWGLTFLPTGEALVGERSSGRIYRIPADGGERTLVGTVPGVVPDGEGGLLGLAVDPLFIHDSFVYAYLTAEADNRIIRFRLDAGRAGGLRRRGGPRRHREGRQPRRWRAGVRAGRDAVRRGGRRRSACTGAGPRLPQRQDPADGPARRPAARGPQPGPGLARLVDGAPQRARPGLGLARPPVGHRVRAGHLRRGQPDRAGRQLRMAGGRGHG